MHILHSIGTNGRVEQLQHMLRWERNANGFYYTHMCIMYSCMHAKVDYMMANTFMYATIAFNYKKVTCIVPASSYRVATSVEH